MDCRDTFRSLFTLLQLSHCDLYDVVDQALAVGNAGIALSALTRMHNMIKGNKQKVQKSMCTVVSQNAVACAKARALRPINIAEGEFDYQAPLVCAYNQMMLYNRDHATLYSKMYTLLQEYYERLVVFESRSQAYYALIKSWALSEGSNPFSADLRAAMRAAGRDLDAEKYCDAYLEMLCN